jgi:hypothetical protein
MVTFFNPQQCWAKPQPRLQKVQSIEASAIAQFQQGSPEQQQSNEDKQLVSSDHVVLVRAIGGGAVLPRRSLIMLSNELSIRAKTPL